MKISRYLILILLKEQMIMRMFCGLQIFVLSRLYKRLLVSTANLFIIVFFIKTGFKAMEGHPRNNSLETEEESTNVEIYLSCKNIAYSAVIVQVFLQERNRPKKKVFQSKRTQVHGHAADFAQSIIIEYFFEHRQKLTIEVFDASGSRKKSLGEVEATIGEIFGGRYKGIAKDILNMGEKKGELMLRCDMIEKGCQKYIQFDMTVKNLQVGSSFLCCQCFGLNEAYWQLYKTVNNEELLIHKSEVKLGKNVQFDHYKINLKKLCNENPKQPISLKFFTAEEAFIGESHFDLASLKAGHRRLELKNKNQDKGIAMFQNYKESVKYDFTEFLSAGMQMAMVLCIDFTASNGQQKDPNSLHHYTAIKKSQYEEALHEFSAIVLDYDTDKLVPCFGFGAKVNMPNFKTFNKVHHCFPMNGNDKDPNLFQLQGIEKGYRNCLQYLQFSGPTYFGPLLREAMEVCKKMKEEQKQYMILLILTDGVIHDKEEVKDLLVKCGKLPLSIVIVGIGDGGGDDWKIMDELDDNDMQMTDFEGNKTVRDLVQFTEFQKFKNNGVDLASQVLYQLPRQVEEYHMLNDLTPEIYKKNLDIEEQLHRRK